MALISPPAIEWTRYDKSRVNSRFESASLASIFPLNFHDSTIGQRLESAISKVALIPLCKVFSNGVSQSWRKKFSFSKPPSKRISIDRSHHPEIQATISSDSYPFNTAYKQLIFMHKHRVWRIPFLENEQPIVSKINILNAHEQPLFISLKNIYIFLFLCRKHSSLNFSKRKRKKFFLARFAGELRKKKKRKRSSVFSRRDEEERSEKLEALFVKRAICRPIIRRRSERWKESTLDAFARAMSVRNRTSPTRLGLGEGEEAGN